MVKFKMLTEVNHLEGAQKAGWMSKTQTMVDNGAVVTRCFNPVLEKTS